MNQPLEEWIKPENITMVIMGIELIKTTIVLGYNTYEEQDFACYYEHMQNILRGNLEYDKIGSRAGGLVYPALHTYILLFFYQYLSDDGMYFRPVQCFSAITYLGCVYLMIKITQLAFKKEPKRANILILHCFTWTIYNIAIVKLFNDLYCVFFSLLGVYLFQKSQNFAGVLMFSLSLGIKMSAWLYLPAIYFIASRSEGILIGTLYLIFIAAFQILIALPFLEVSAHGYISSAFDTTRGFLLQHSFTFKFLPTDFGDNFWFKTVTLSIHLFSLLYFLLFKWTTLKKVFKEISLWPFRFLPSFKEQDPLFIAEVFFICNFTGILWSRGIHFQFIIWFLFSFPFLIEVGSPSIRHWRARHVISLFWIFELFLSIRPDYLVATATMVHIGMMIVWIRLCMKPRTEENKLENLEHEMIEDHTKEREFEFLPR